MVRTALEVRVVDLRPLLEPTSVAVLGASERPSVGGDMVESLRRLPEATQQALRLAACVGNTFDLRTLALIAERPMEEVGESLQEALRRGVVVPLTDSYTLLNVSAGYRFSRGGLVHDFMLRGRNLTDELARNHASRLKDLVPLPGTDISLVYRLIF